MEINILSNTIKNMVENDVKVDVKMTQKGNRVLTGISIGKGDVRPVVYMENYEDLFHKSDYKSVAKKMIEDCKNAYINIPTTEVVTWEYAKDNLILCVAPSGKNDGCVTIPYLDLELYFRVNAKGGTYKVRQDMLNIWNVGRYELLEIATQTNEYNMSSMLDKMIELLGEDGDEFLIEELRNDHNANQFVVTNSENLFGASAIYDINIFKEIADKCKSDLYIIPSSIHELIVTPMSNLTVEDMNNMIRETNESQVSPEERLSDHVYIYRRNAIGIEY